VDCTFGAGGHARLIADRIGSTGTLVCIDRDPLAEEHFDGEKVLRRVLELALA
jgi:16S rRNA (cytosine1402-N4)-methyltransferase